MGEALSDYLVHTIDPYIAVAIGGVGIVVSLALQFFVRRYIAPVYWFAVAMVAVFGTMCADAAHIELKIPYAESAAICATGLTAIFIVWYLSERTLSIHSINTRRREMFYWAAVLATFAMGTAVGASYADWLGVPQSLGGLNYGRGTVAVGLTLAIIAWVGYLWVTKVDVEP